LLPLATKVQEHFQRLRGIANALSEERIISPLTAADGIAMGEALMMTVKRAKNKGKKTNGGAAAAVKQFISEYKAMRMLSKEFTWIEVMLVEILKNVKTRKVENVGSKLICLENEEARSIGAALITIVAKSINEKVGVNDWFEKYPSMKELSQRHSFLAPMLGIIATQTVREVNWRMILRAALKAFVSFFDLLTDLYMIFFYFSNDQGEYAKATIGMILMSLFMQCFTIFLMYHGDKKAMKREFFYALTFVKGGRLQLAVLKGKDSQGCSVEVVNEMVVFEAQEVSRTIVLY
jgi:hypothetical protein